MSLIGSARVDQLQGASITVLILLLYSMSTVASVGVNEQRDIILDLLWIFAASFVVLTSLLVLYI